jgi:hypothetical protein
LPAAVGAAALVAVSVLGWAWTTPETTLRGHLVEWQFWTLEVQFAIAAAALVHQLPRVAAALGAGRRTWLAAAACALLCLGLTASVAPRTSRIFFDEQIYQAVGRSLADTRLAQMCNEGTVEYGRLQCWSGEYSKQPYAYPYVLSLAYRAAGPAPWIAHAVNNLAAAATVLVVFALTVLAYRSRASGIGAALVMAVVPMQLVWSNTGASEPTAALACALAVTAAFAFVRGPSTVALIWCAAATVFAASFRPECLLVVPLVLAVVLAGARGEIGRPRFWWILAGAAALGWNVVAHAIAVRHEPWGAVGERMSVSFVSANLRTNGLFYLWDERFPALFTGLALVAVLARSRTRATWAFVGYFALFWGVFLLFYAGSYDYGADVRYSLMTYPPLAVLAGAGAAWTVQRFEGSVGAARAAAIGAGALLFHMLLYLPIVRAVGEEAWAARADVDFIERAVQAIPPNSIVLTHTPSTLLLRGVNAAQTATATTGEARVRGDLFSRYAGGVYLYWNFWCNVPDPAQQVYCTAALDRFGHEIVREERVRTYRFVLYRLLP